MMFSKYIIVVDEDCDVHNTSEVLFRLCANTDPARDSTVIKNPSDSLDHAPSEQNIGSHMGFDATRKLPGENYHRPWPELLKMTEEAQKLRRTPFHAESGKAALLGARLAALETAAGRDAALRRPLRGLDRASRFALRSAEHSAGRGIAHQSAVRNSSHIDQAMRRIRAHHETGLTTPLGDRITALRHRPIFPGTIFLDGMANESTCSCTSSGSNGGPARMTRGQATNDRAAPAP